MKSRRFGGKMFHASSMNHRTKATAEAEAKRRRKRNQNARVVKVPSYKVFFRQE